MGASMVAVFIGTAICAGPLLGLVGRRLSGVGGWLGWWHVTAPVSPFGPAPRWRRS